MVSLRRSRTRPSKRSDRRPDGSPPLAVVIPGFGGGFLFLRAFFFWSCFGRCRRLGGRGRGIRGRTFLMLSGGPSVLLGRGSLHRLFLDYLSQLVQVAADRIRKFSCHGRGCVGNPQFAAPGHSITSSLGSNRRGCSAIFCPRLWGSGRVGCSTEGVNAMNKAWLSAGIAVAGALLAAQVAAQDAWPSKPVKFIVPSSPGGGTDLYARLIGQALSESLKQQFVIDNRPGASGNIGADAVAKSAPDGYTFLVSANPALTVNPSLYKNLPYNAERDFAPVARGVIAPQV